MNQRYIFTAIAVVVVLIIAFFIFNNNQESDVASETNSTENANTVSENTNADTNTNATVNTNTNTNGQTNTEPAMDGNDVAVFEINYDGTAFSPSQLTIKKGDVVVFKNNSTKSFWPASGPHPEHTNYPEFDPKKSIAAGQSWTFKFTQTGAWPFHDHLNSSAFGKITVAQ